MPKRSKKYLSRREWLARTTLLACGTLFFGLDQTILGQTHDYLAGARFIGVIPFVGEPNQIMDRPVFEELDGRLLTDLSTIGQSSRVIPTEIFYIRSRASKLLKYGQPWSIKITWPEGSVDLPIEKLLAESYSMGVHLMECSGNTIEGHFGMIGTAAWSGVPFSRILEPLKMAGRPGRILVSGFDTYVTKSRTSIPGASWIFSVDDLINVGAFLATHMNGKPLTLDHGSPVRLFVPHWYGCASIKWVNEISVVDENAEATSQMKEYAGRTMQKGVPRLAKDYEPALIDPAAMPIRIEKWHINERTVYRVVGLLWGGLRTVDNLLIRFNPNDPYVRVGQKYPVIEDSWTFWTHVWQPKKTGTYRIRLKIDEPPLRTRRLDMGFYDRSVTITEPSV